MILTVNRDLFFRSIVVAVLCGVGFLASAQVEVNSTLTPDEYVNDVLLGTGVEATNVVFTGSPTQIGHITGFDPSEFPIEAGLILSTEVANNPANVDDGCVDDLSTKDVRCGQPGTSGTVAWKHHGHNSWVRSSG